MKKTIIILAKTKIGNLNRTTVPERVREILGLDMGDSSPRYRRVSISM